LYRLGSLSLHFGRSQPSVGQPQPSYEPDDIEQVKKIKYVELLNELQNGTKTLQQYEAELFKLLQK
ncbi:unnamed protein product, partial [Rotaria sp. Silwood1]